MVLGNVGSLLKEINSPESSQSNETDKSPKQITEKMDSQSGDTEQTVEESTCSEQYIDSSDGKAKGQGEVAMETTSEENSGKEKHGKGKRRKETVSFKLIYLF